MAPYSAVGLWTAPVLSQKQRQMPPRWTKIGRIERSQQRIGLDPFVEPIDQGKEERIAPNALVEIVFLGLEVDEHGDALERLLSRASRQHRTRYATGLRGQWRCPPQTRRSHLHWEQWEQS